MRATTLLVYRVALACLAGLGACFATAAEPTSAGADGVSHFDRTLGRIDYALAASPTPGLRLCLDSGPAFGPLARMPACGGAGVHPTSGVGFWAKDRALRTAGRDVAKSLDTNRFLVYLRSRALPLHGAATCARHVREALEAAGFVATGHPTRAKDWGPLLHRMGFASADPSTYRPAHALE